MIYFLQTHITEKEFYQKLDFYIFLVIGGLALWFSILSWMQAKGAKTAAERAGQIVKIQDILLGIPEITNLCQLDFTDDYKKATPQLTTIIGKISLVIGVIKEDAKQNQSQQTLIGEIEKTISEIRDVLKSLNPIYMDSATTQIKEIDGRIYYAITPYLQLLVSQLNFLSGKLHGQMIQNK